MTSPVWKAVSLFATPVVAVEMGDVSGVRDFFYARIKDQVVDAKQRRQTSGQITHYHSGANVFEIYPELTPLGERLEEAGSFVYRDLLNYKRSGRMRIKGAWFNLCDLGGTQPRHNHANCLLSGTLYLHADEHTAISFHSPQSIFSTHAELHDQPDEGPNTHGLTFHYQHAAVPVRSGDCLFWPSPILHSYEDNKTPARLTLSFNLLPERLNSLYQL
ncbi:MAG TPA: putative 2OG-Fe(II) oxygenase [Caulobacterales bacterium]|nr:putative 2OG-Fe(II) oxygenase [Caulobacterales bacterium]